MSRRYATWVRDQHAELKRLWSESCEHDGIDPDVSAFCAFSQNNPHAVLYNKLAGVYQQNIQESEVIIYGD